MKIKYLCYVFFCLLFFGCESSMIMEITDINSFSVTEKNVDENLFLEISGLCMKSSYVVESIKAVQREDVLFINVVLSFMNKKGKSGSFDETIFIPSTVNKVVLGKNNAVIWKRE